VAHELGAALNGRISADLLLAHELDPGKLARAFRDARPLPAAQLSEAEAELYGRALEQTARYLVAVATQLPRFVERLATTQLQRIGRMEGEFTRALESVRRIEEQVALLSPDKTYAKFEADYRQIVSQNVDELELFGVDVDPQAKRYKLSVAYISLSLQASSTDEEESTLVPAEHILQQLRPGAGRLLIRGDAGSGKSTLFRWAALMAATGGGKVSSVDHAWAINIVSAHPTDFRVYFGPGPHGALRGSLGSVSRTVFTVSDVVSPAGCGRRPDHAARRT
jgi:hypothetical protein